ncbi:HD domain-containing phosphohydrolase [Microbacterium aerolatum]|uniref:Metal-dependent phosphohydrolase n=1 Tax=Microbacterium aerolatum TaxID=153731 RepID=A0A511AH08_9MICO|nr:HD domain-containing phosphohydrolase [Microbacterium aerolatum]GEK87470.1 metal-dependent phosphohydrolase [Microbacterium aerolatum]GGB23691.1 metal-dependent phosphohydrolase [Microbacterium aerolatum]
MDPSAPQRHGLLPRRIEVLAGLSVAIDLGLGQPAEHMLRTAVIACWLADRLGLSSAQRATTYYTALIMWIGCNADSQEYARWFGDDIAVRRDSYSVDWSGMPFMRFLLGNIGRGEPVAKRVLTIGTLLRDARGQLGALMHSHCMSAAELADHIGLPSDVEQAVGFTFERFDGSGLPRGCTGDEIPIEMRIAQIADVAEVHHRMRGIDAAVATLSARRGGHFDPVIVDAVVDDPEPLFAEASDGDVWSAAIQEAPDAETRLDQESLGRLVSAIGDFADLKCPFTLGHSRAVATLAADAGALLGREADEVHALRRAGHLHDIGKLGVSSQIWSKPGDLTASEWERVRMHPYLTDRVLSRISGLERERTYARAHHEHLDGSGYPLGTSATSLGRGERILAVAVAYQSALEPRPYREARDPAAAAAEVRERSAHGQLDPECTEAVLSVAGHEARRVRSDDGLTAREREVLAHVARGLSNRQIAETLVLSEKTVRNHMEHVYVKIGASNRVGASLYALQHGLATPFA